MPSLIVVILSEYNNNNNILKNRFKTFFNLYKLDNSQNQNLFVFFFSSGQIQGYQDALQAGNSPVGIFLNSGLTLEAKLQAIAIVAVCDDFLLPQAGLDTESTTHYDDHYNNQYGYGNQYDNNQNYDNNNDNGWGGGGGDDFGGGDDGGGGGE